MISCKYQRLTIWAVLQKKKHLYLRNVAEYSFLGWFIHYSCQLFLESIHQSSRRFNSSAAMQHNANSSVAVPRLGGRSSAFESSTSSSSPMGAPGTPISASPGKFYNLKLGDILSDKNFIFFTVENISFTHIG